jgi:hypothetical protein
LRSLAWFSLGKWCWVWSLLRCLSRCLSSTCKFQVTQKDCQDLCLVYSQPRHVLPAAWLEGAFISQLQVTRSTPNQQGLSLQDCYVVVSQGLCMQLRSSSVHQATPPKTPVAKDSARQVEVNWLCASSWRATTRQSGCRNSAKQGHGRRQKAACGEVVHHKFGQQAVQ